jgi:ribosomal-protein-alanine N-acetyltransferase
MELRMPVEADEAGFVEMVLASGEAWAPWVPKVDASLTPAARFRREVERARRGAEAGTHLRLIASLDGEIVVLFALNDIVRGVFENGHAAWQVSARQMGRGVGTEGVHALLAAAFEEAPNGVGLHRVQANIMPGNLASLRIAQKVGFRREGVAERYLRIAGRWEDHVIHALTREEWPGTN